MADGLNLDLIGTLSLGHINAVPSVFCVLNNKIISMLIGCQSASGIPLRQSRVLTFRFVGLNEEPHSILRPAKKPRYHSILKCTATSEYGSRDTKGNYFILYALSVCQSGML